MGHYITLIRYTQQGAAKIKESPARLDAAKKAAEAAGGKIHAWYLTMGKYDAVIISEFRARLIVGKLRDNYGIVLSHGQIPRVDLSADCLGGFLRRVQMRRTFLNFSSALLRVPDLPQL